MLREWGHDLPKKGACVGARDTSVRRLGLKCALSAKAIESRLVVVDALDFDDPKTKALVETLQRHSPAWLSGHGVLFLHATAPSEAFSRAVANIPRARVLAIEGANVRDIVQRDFVVFTVDALQALT